MLSVSKIAKKYGVTKNAVLSRFKTRGIAPVVIGKGQKPSFYSVESVEKAFEEKRNPNERRWDCVFYEKCLEITASISRSDRDNAVCQEDCKRYMTIDEYHRWKNIHEY